MIRFAVNICDCTYDNVQTMAALMMTPVTPKRIIVRGEKGRVDSDAVVLECEEKRAKAICQVLRMKTIQNGRKVRCYVEGARGGWRDVKDSDLKVKE